MRRLVSTHAEDVGGFMVEPGEEFDESDADEATIERLENEGKLADAESSESEPESESEKPTRKSKPSEGV